MDWHSIFEIARGDAAFLFPEAMLVFFGLATLLTDFLLTTEQKSWNALTAMLGVALSGASLWVLVRPAAEYVTAFSNSIVVDPFFICFGCVLLAATAFTILLSVRYLQVAGRQGAEFYALILFAATGMLFLASGSDLVVLFVALEMMSISFYILTGYFRSERRSNEAAVKSMLTGAFSSAVLAYGFSILYGIAGSTNLQAIERAVLQRHADFPGMDLLTFLALGTITAGVFAKIAAVPFHFWAPDAYEGAPTPVSAYISVGSQVAGFALLLRLYLTVFWPVNVDWSALMAVAGVLSLTVGTFAALTQTNLKRLLAYSSIAQGGYILLGLASAVNRDGSLHERGLQATVFYIFTYVFFNAGAFAVVTLLQRRGEINDEIDDLNGLARRNPVAAVLMLIFLMSLGGIPPTAGFVAKLLVLWSLVESGHPYLALAAALFILPSVYYYFRIVAAMWVREPGEEPATPLITVAQKFALAGMVAVTLAAGIFPEQFLHFARYSVLGPLGL
ncbi:MAG TPA: NADH-quinone oxidoreductase subunit N [Candidatus Acidoferrales bacterium]